MRTHLAPVALLTAAVLGGTIAATGPTASADHLPGVALTFEKKVAVANEDPCGADGVSDLHVAGPTEVRYCYVISNAPEPDSVHLTIEELVDDHLGPIAIDDPELSTGEVQQIVTDPVLISETTHNVATLTASFTAPDAPDIRDQWQAAATVTVGDSNPGDLPQIDLAAPCVNGDHRLHVTITNPDPADNVLDVRVDGSTIAPSVEVPGGETVELDLPYPDAPAGALVELVVPENGIVLDSTTLPARAACSLQGDPNFTG